MSSTTSLISSQSKQRQSPQKDWTSAFATLSSLYGFDGKAPSTSSTPQKPSKLRNNLSYVPPRSKNCDAPTDSLPVQKTRSLEGYELAFGQLASLYGFGGPTISQPKKH
ncbi:hypothetical protein BYT27DRAFT_7188266 [Phlegmacium glaucopus]|nr:hypothetical protein BYT27DRAFT_7188266 [Phlegmacium glaucopus]